MMQAISTYHRPSTLEEALALLGRDDPVTVVLGGGTVVTAADLAHGTAVVDIQAVADSTIGTDGDRVIYGSMVRIQDMVDHEPSPRLLVETALREGPNTLRNAATIGGTVARAHSDSELIAALLVHDASIAIARADGAVELPLAGLLSDRSPLEHGIITRVSVDRTGETASARTGRTPADTSIVAAMGRIVAGGIHLALTGVARNPVLVDPADLEQIEPSGDFRGSPEYRKELAKVLVNRVLDQLGGVS